jgi:uncharacterized protein (PEP-CTERM system associated)
MQGSVLKPDASLSACLAAALLLALPAAAQTVPPAAGGTATPVAPGESGTAPAATPALESPALGPLGGRDQPLVTRPSESGTLSGFAATAPGFGGYGIGTPFDLGNRPYAIRPSIGIEVLGTNNLFQTNYDQRSDVVTTIAPRLEAAVDTPRLSGSLRYAPALRLYGTYSNQDGLEQVGDGQLLAMAVPGLLYLDIRGAASVLPVLGGYIPGSGQAIAASNTLQTYTAQVTPFLAYRFGTAASMQVGYSFQYSGQNFANFSQTGIQNLTGAQSSTANYTANRGFAVMRSGEDFGRLALQARVDGTWYAGNGIYDDAQRFFSTLEARYAILPSVAVLGEIGYENIEYAGTNPGNIDDAVWSAGLRLTPSRNSIVIVRYGHLYGFNSFNLNAGVALGVRTELFATYRETLNTSLTQAQDLLATTTTDALGNPVDSQSGAPVMLIYPFLGLSDTLYRMRIGTVSLSHRWPRDVLTLSDTWQAQDPVSSSTTAVTISSSNGTYATLNWAHEFSPRTSAVATMQYGHISYGQPGQSDGDLYGLAGTLVHQLSEKLAGTLQIAWTSNAAATAQGYTQGVIRVGLRRSF